MTIEDVNKAAFTDPEKAVENTSYLTSVFDDLNKRFPEELEHSQGRSNFQLESYVALNDYTISSVYKHCLT